MGCNYPYRGSKSKFEEGGIKAPTLVFSTQRTFEHRQIGKLFHITDWFATILGLGSIDVPATNNELSLDSLDFSGLLGQDRNGYSNLLYQLYSITFTIEFYKASQR